jgi:hypothetical protein
LLNDDLAHICIYDFNLFWMREDDPFNK